jgi:hypothetical protein
MAKRNFIITIVLILIIVASNSFAADKYQWTLVDTKDGCQIYTSVVAGKEYIASKTTCVIPARMEIIATLIRDIANYPEWMENCKETKILKFVDDENDVSIFWFRQHITLFTDRDMVLKSTVKRNIEKGQYLIYGDLTNEMSYDSGKGYIRMPSFNSLFTLDWIDREQTRVTLMIDPDIGKGVPSSIANSLIRKTPYKSLKKMMKEVKKSKYIESAKTNKYNRMVENAIKAGFLKP